MRKRIKIPIYLGELHIIQEADLDQIKQKYDLKHMDGAAAIVFKISEPNCMTKYMMAFTFDCTPSMIAHEALHIVAHIYKDRGIEFDRYNDESQCYLLGWIVEKCFKVLKIN
ncbi:MAG: hypothetical protein WC238_04790 [Parcubacteria group bacterium]|jgi:hypothetical protein